MVTNYPQHLTATSAGRESAGSVFTKLTTWIAQRLCGVRGHEALRHFEDKRVTMRCTLCGHETPGWEIAQRGPRLRFEGDARRHRLNTPRLVLRKSA